MKLLWGLDLFQYSLSSLETSIHLFVMIYHKLLKFNVKSIDIHQTKSFPSRKNQNLVGTIIRGSVSLKDMLINAASPPHRSRRIKRRSGADWGWREISGGNANIIDTPPLEVTNMGMDVIKHCMRRVREGNMENKGQNP